MVAQNTCSSENKNYLHVTSSSSKCLFQQWIGINGACWLWWLPANFLKSLLDPSAIKLLNVVTCPCPTYVQSTVPI